MLLTESFNHKVLPDLTGAKKIIFNILQDKLKKNDDLFNSNYFLKGFNCE